MSVAFSQFLRAKTTLKRLYSIFFFLNHDIITVNFECKSIWLGGGGGRDAMTNV